MYMTAKRLPNADWYLILLRASPCNLKEHLLSDIPTKIPAQELREGGDVIVLELG